MTNTCISSLEKLWVDGKSPNRWVQTFVKHMMHFFTQLQQTQLGLLQHRNTNSNSSVHRWSSNTRDLRTVINTCKDCKPNPDHSGPKRMQHALISTGNSLVGHSVIPEWHSLKVKSHTCLQVTLKWPRLKQIPLNMNIKHGMKDLDLKFAWEDTSMDWALVSLAASVVHQLLWRMLPPI